MSNNEYRRELVLLRALDSAASGFCRVEARAMRGGIQYNLRLRRQLAGPLHAVLAGTRGGVWRAVSGGIIRRGEGEQVNYSWEFDPRSVGGMALEHYSVVGVAEAGSDARLLLAGQLEKGCIIDWESAERAVRELLGAERDASPTAEPDDTSEAGEASRAQTVVESDETAEERAHDDGETEHESHMETNAEAREIDERHATDGSGTGDLLTAQAEIELNETAEEYATRDGEAEDSQPAQPSAESEEIAEERATHDGAIVSAATDLPDPETTGEVRISLGGLEELIERAVSRAVIAACRNGECPSHAADEPTPTCKSGAAPTHIYARGITEIATDGNIEIDRIEPVSYGSDELLTRDDPPAQSEYGSETSKACVAIAPEAEERRPELQIPATISKPAAPDCAPPSDAPCESVVFESNGMNTCSDARTFPDAIRAECPQPRAWALDGVCEPDAPWPENCRELRELFLNNPRADNVRVPGYTFVNAPLPDECGTPYCAVGVNCRAGAPYSICFAIPGPHSPLPPAGLEGYKYVPGTDTGFWIVRQYADSGELIFGDE